MDFRIDVWHHFESDASVHQKLDAILTQLAAVAAQGVLIMSKLDELEAELVEANSTTNEIAADIDDLMAQLAGGLTPAEADQVKAKLVELKTSLQNVAAKHTPPTP